ncbi:MAG: hypothetical protein A2286_06635 [Gammaproteobacteria bacterium RIFOXYA12_FULL_61_12]|nr:MAG: hypothetical protein A2514_10595 [Gammaproteobacteria bacterium RIFOXYD12_FULL_61_37]OGT91235.1 MAG: hypothetical protein A2286_06635 [Gammaproteobacteria bacterium RIFOXYA12_FULL_61_12]
MKDMKGKLRPYGWLLIGGTVYLLLHLAVRLLFSDTLQVDDTEQILVGQYLTTGISNGQPPLYSWISWLLFRVFGTSLATLTWLKYGLLWLSFWVGFLISRRLFEDPRLVALASAAWLLLPPFAWTMHQGFTHTILLGLAILMSFHAVLLIRERPGAVRYLYLGFAVGLGLLSKYSFPLFLLPLLGAALTLPGWRGLLLDRRMLLAIGVALLLASNHYLLLAANPQSLVQGLGPKLVATETGGLLAHFVALGRFLFNALEFVAPFLLIFAIFFPSLFRRSPEPGETERLLERFFLLLLLGLLATAAITVLPPTKTRWMHPLMMLFPYWLLLRLAHRGELLTKGRLRRVWGIIGGITLVILAGRVVQVTIGPRLGMYGRLNFPTVETLRKLPEPLLNGTPLLVRDYALMAHLLIHFPKVRFADSADPVGGQRAAILWQDEEAPVKLDKARYRTGWVETVTAGYVYRLEYALPVPP